MPTFEATRRGFLNLWNKAEQRSDWKGRLDEYAGEIISDADRYKAIEASSGVPWFWIGCTHTRESNRNFSTYLGNGQPLSRKTTIVPIGRGPFNSFEEGAIDAMDAKKLSEIESWPIERCLYEFERFNGFGYMRPNIQINSPYNWSGTTLYLKGKYVADHAFSRTAVDKQPGCAAILKSLIVLDESVRKHFDLPEEPPPTDDKEELLELVGTVEDALEKIKVILTKT